MPKTQAGPVIIAPMTLLEITYELQSPLSDDQLRHLGAFANTYGLRRFRLDDTTASRLIEQATEADRRAVDLYNFTSRLARSLDEEGRRRIIEMMWEIVHVGGPVGDLEQNFVWRAADLIGVPARERIALRRRIAARAERGEAAFAPSSFAGLTSSLVVWLLSGGTLVLHHPFDEEAFETMVRQYGGRMLATARRLLGNEHDANDAVQQAFISVFRSIATFNGEAKLSTWLHRIVVNDPCRYFQPAQAPCTVLDKRVNQNV